METNTVSKIAMIMIVGLLLVGCRGKQQTISPTRNEPFWALPYEDEHPAFQETAGLAPCQAKEIEAEYKDKANKVLKHIILSQMAMHGGKASDALHHVKISLSVFETADAHALKGSIYYHMGYREKAMKHWIKAHSLDPGSLTGDLKTLISAQQKQQSTNIK